MVEADHPTWELLDIAGADAISLHEASQGRYEPRLIKRMVEALSKEKMLLDYMKSVGPCLKDAS